MSMVAFGPSLGLPVGNVATYRSHGAACWQPTGMGSVRWSFGVECWKPTGLLGPAGPSRGAVCLQIL